MSTPTVALWDGKRFAPVSLAAAIKTLPDNLLRFGYQTEADAPGRLGAPARAWGRKAVDEVALCMRFITTYCEPSSDETTDSDALAQRINDAQRRALEPMKVTAGSVIAAARLLGYTAVQVTPMLPLAAIGLRRKPADQRATRNKRTRT